MSIGLGPRWEINSGPLQRLRSILKRTVSSNEARSKAAPPRSAPLRLVRMRLASLRAGRGAAPVHGPRRHHRPRWEDRRPPRLPRLAARRLPTRPGDCPLPQRRTERIGPIAALRRQAGCRRRSSMLAHLRASALASALRQNRRTMTTTAAVGNSHERTSARLPSPLAASVRPGVCATLRQPAW
jgi:hypothetical protein